MRNAELGGRGSWEKGAGGELDVRGGGYRALRREGEGEEEGFDFEVLKRLRTGDEDLGLHRVEIGRAHV